MLHVHASLLLILVVEEVAVFGVGEDSHDAVAVSGTRIWVLDSDGLVDSSAQLDIQGPCIYIHPDPLSGILNTPLVSVSEIESE
jgi:hypothetical protein